MRRSRVCLLAIAAALVPFQAVAFDRSRLPSAASLEPCPSYGTGFARIPGTSTCIRVSGRVATGADVGTGRSGPVQAPVAGRLSIDTRTETDLGAARSFLRLGTGQR